MYSTREGLASKSNESLLSWTRWVCSHDWSEMCSVRLNNSAAKCFYQLRQLWTVSPSVLWYCWLGLLTCKNRLPYNLYCVGGDVKHCSLTQLWTVRRALSVDNAKKLVHALVFTWLRVGCNTRPRFRVAPCRLLQRGFRRGAEDYYRQIATSVERCCQRHPEVWSWPVTDYAYRASLAGRSWTNQLQTRYAHVPMPAQQSSSVPDGPLHISIRRCLSSTATFCQ